MTKEEVLKKYSISAKLMDKYEKFRQCTSFKDADVENMSMIMTLYDAGFDDAEAERYIRLYLSDDDTASERTAMLIKKRRAALSDIHSRQKQLDGIDYLRYKILRENKKSKTELL